ncbi:unnamed protein product [Onchocerca flexuosa]|uniref:KR domain-containing protein n=1 Tax=Onchocerca flexuosa TaxID=387005 RepID=A0A183H4V0_9BILA|nr:unnamed protein product [Onchocerca flexuosa]
MATQLFETIGLESCQNLMMGGFVCMSGYLSEDIESEALSTLSRNLKANINEKPLVDIEVLRPGDFLHSGSTRGEERITAEMMQHPVFQICK